MAIEQCNKVLPNPWMRQLQSLLDSGKSTIGQVAAALEKAPHSAPGSAAHRRVEQALVRGMLQDAAAVMDAEGPPRCHCCNEMFVGLRKCSACKVAAYCSDSCQREHWAEHKAEFRRLGAAAAAQREGTA